MAKSAAAQHSKAYRERKNAEAERLGIEKLTIETARGVREAMTAAAKAHGYSQVQELWQDLALAFLAAQPSVQAARLKKPDTSAFSITPKLARKFKEATRAELKRDPGDEVSHPTAS
jgi:predicted hydrolase (HD superfamily)